MAENGSQDVTIEHLQECIQHLEQENKRWMRLAGINRLTDLPNSLMLYQIIMPAELKKCDERGIALACFLLSPDALGDVNRDYGRAVGDELVKQIGLFLKQRMEQGERLFHPDGANFAVLITDATEGRAKRRATEVKADLRRQIFTVKGKEFKDLTCSVGVASFEGVVLEANVPKCVEGMYQDLSDRLYKAKERGENLIVGSSLIS